MEALTLIVIAGLLGPLISSFRRIAIPIVIGEILGGILLGPAVLDLVSIHDPVVDVLHKAGFAVLMFTVGMHLPLKDKSLRAQARPGLLAALATFAVGAGVGYAIALLTHFHHPLVIVLLVANSSAALAIPVIRSTPNQDSPATTKVILWIMLTDLLAVFALPLVGGTHPLPEVILGSLAVTAAAWLSFAALRRLGRTSWWKNIQEESINLGWGWTLRICLVLLFSLTWLAAASGTSALVAGFAVGVAVSAVGANDRLLAEIIGIGEGFFIPAFFVALGTTLNPESLTKPATLYLTALLSLGAILVHQAGALLLRVNWRNGLVATAALGVPAAVVTLGVSGHWLSPSQADAVMASALVSIGICSLGAALLPGAASLKDRGSLTSGLLPPLPAPKEQQQ